MDFRLSPPDGANPIRHLRRLSPSVAFSGLYIAQFLFLGLQLPFFPGWLEANGFTPPEIGYLVGIALVARVIFAPALAYRGEAASDPLRLLRLTAAALFLLSLILVVPAPKIVTSFAVIGLLFVFGLLVPLTDTAVLRADRRGELTYGRARGLGSLSFIVSLLVGGAIIGATGDEAVVRGMALAGFLTALAGLLLPAEPQKSSGEPQDRPTPRQALALIRSPSFLFMLMATGLVQGGHATYYAFAELHWSHLGYSSFLIGVLWTVGVGAEICLLVWARPLISRVNPAVLIVLGAVATIVRWPIIGMSPPLWVVIIFQLLHALTFAATYLGSVEFVARAVPPAFRSTAMTVVSTFGIGAFTGIATTIAGQIFVASAPLPAYGLMSAMGGIALAFAIALWRRWDGGPLRRVPTSS